MLKIRIRGIYATALTKDALDAGFKVVQPSDVIIDRFKLEPSYDVPDLTIKDSERIKGALTIIGKCWAVEKYLNHLMDKYGNFIYWRSKIPLHSIIIGIVKKIENNKAILDLGGIEAIMPGRGYMEGDRVPVTIVKTAVLPNEEVLASPELRVDGNYASLIPGGKVVLSRHIKDPEKKAELMSLGFMLKDKLGSYGIKWRSSAQYAEMKTLIEEVEQLLEKLSEVQEKLSQANDYEVICEGECIVEILPTGTFRKRLDDIRNQVVPTIIGHHSIKIRMKKTSIIDFMEYLIGKIPDKRLELSRAFHEYIIDRRYKVILYHYKPTGEVVKIGPGEIIWKDFNEMSVIMFRRFRKEGILNGLGIPKEKGDYALSYVKLENTYIVHTYFNSSGKLKGIYININTPIELAKNGFQYIDLIVDVVKVGNELKIIDKEEFEKLKEQHCLTESIINQVEKTLDFIINNVDEIVKPCLEINDKFKDELIGKS